MEIKKYNNFIDENKSQDDVIHYYAFDWDDNILFMSTKIHMENKINGKWIEKDVSTSKYSEIRTDSENWRLLDNDPLKAFSDFKDDDKRKTKIFLEDVKESLSNKNYGPSWNDFIECIKSGSIFAIITSRGHQRETLKEGVELIIDTVFTNEDVRQMYNNLLKFRILFNQAGEYDKIIVGKPSENSLVQKYLCNCIFVGISSPEMNGKPESPELLKQQVLLDFKYKINSYVEKIGFKAKIGFSDDDLNNVKKIEDLINNINREKFPNIIHYVVKNTNNPNIIHKTVKKFESAPKAPGLEASIMPFTQFNNMTNRLYPSGEQNRQDDYANELSRKTNFVAKTSKELQDEIEKKYKQEESDEKSNKDKKSRKKKKVKKSKN